MKMNIFNRVMVGLFVFGASSLVQAAETCTLSGGNVLEIQTGSGKVLTRFANHFTAKDFTQHYEALVKQGVCKKFVPVQCSIVMKNHLHEIRMANETVILRTEDADQEFISTFQFFARAGFCKPQFTAGKCEMIPGESGMVGVFRNGVLWSDWYMSTNEAKNGLALLQKLKVCETAAQAACLPASQNIVPKELRGVSCLMKTKHP